MAEKILMTALSPTMEAGVVVRWLKKEGDRVEAGDVLCEVETDKATMEYESFAEGTLLKIVAQAGDQAKVGDVIAIIGEAGESIESIGDSSQKLESSGQQLTGQLSGDSSQKFDKVSTGIGDSSQKLNGSSSTGSVSDDRIKASPLARRIAELNNITLNEISGSGPEGRIIKADVERFMMNKPAEGRLMEVQPDEKLQGKESQTGKAFAPVQYAVDSAGAIEVPVSQKRKIIAQRLSESKFSAPHFYLTVSVNVDNLIETRKALNESRQIKVSFNAFLIKYAAEALKRHKMVNASWNGDTIIQRKQIDIALAVAQPDGLITPVVRDCGNKGLIAINQELADLIEKTKNNKLVPEEYQNAGFTISNLGSFGIEEFTAVINPPGSAILAVGEMKKMPVVDKDNNITIQTQMKMTLSCDHRVIDGAVGAAFLKDLKEIIEDPIRALF